MTDKIKKKRRRKNTKEEILSAAIDLFSERGFSAVSIRDITRKVGINESSLYNHFKSKDSLPEAIIEKITVELGEAVFCESTIEDQLEVMEPSLFLKNHLLSLRKKITPEIEKIWKIIYMEQFRDQRARDFVLKELIGRTSKYYERAFEIMIEKELIKKIDPKLLSNEYSYTLLAFSLEKMLLDTNNEETTSVRNKMFAHIDFICSTIKKDTL